MKTVPILFSFDDRMLMPAVVCMTSLLENAGPETFYDIIILHRPEFDFSGTALAELPRRYPRCKMTFRKVGDDFLGAYEIRGISVETYFRLLASELIPEYDKILYSDDNGSALRPGVRVHLDEIGLDYRKGYYYAGNIVMNLAQIRKDGMIDVFKELGKKAFPQQDMDILNIACNGRILPVGPSFCLTIFLYELIVKRRQEMEAIHGAEELDHALRSGIVHYNGPKPWKQECLNMDIWWDYYRRSPVFDEAFCYDFWQDQLSRLDRMSLMKRIKHVGRYFRK